MAEITYTFEELDYEIAQDVWIPEALSGRAEIECNRGEEDDWHVTSVTLDTTGPRVKIFDWKSIAGSRICTAVEKALQKSDAHSCDITDELVECRYTEREFEKELA